MKPMFCHNYNLSEEENNKNLEAFKIKEAIDNIKPAHMLYEFKYTYTTWSYLDSKNLTWKNAESLPWDQLEIYE